MTANLGEWLPATTVAKRAGVSERRAWEIIREVRPLPRAGMFELELTNYLVGCIETRRRAASRRGGRSGREAGRRPRG